MYIGIISNKSYTRKKKKLELLLTSVRHLARAFRHIVVILAYAFFFCFCTRHKINWKRRKYVGIERFTTVKIASRAYFYDNLLNERVYPTANSQNKKHEFVVSGSICIWAKRVHEYNCVLYTRKFHNII